MEIRLKGSIPSRIEAHKLLDWAHEQNPGLWAEHSRIVAKAAETIARACGLDTETAYISGLMHDIGRYEGIRGLHHVYAGYELLSKLGYGGIAGICLSHSFPYRDIGAYSGGGYDCTPSELSVITDFLANVEDHCFDSFDKLIQLCDSLGSASGVCVIEVRAVDVIRRYGFDDFTLRKLDAIFELKKYFDNECFKHCGKKVYDLFVGELRMQI